MLAPGDRLSAIARAGPPLRAVLADRPKEGVAQRGLVCGRATTDERRPPAWQAAVETPSRPFVPRRRQCHDRSPTATRAGASSSSRSQTSAGSSLRPLVGKSRCMRGGNAWLRPRPIVPTGSVQPHIAQLGAAMCRSHGQGNSCGLSPSIPSCGGSTARLGEPCQRDSGSAGAGNCPQAAILVG